MRCSVGEFFDVAVDLCRALSHGRVAELSAENQKQLWCRWASPMALPSVSWPKCNTKQAASNRNCECSLRWNDPALAIAWPLLRAGVQEPPFATKDAEAPRWRPWRLPGSCSDENHAHWLYWTARPGLAHLPPVQLAGEPVDRSPRPVSRGRPRT